MAARVSEFQKVGLIYVLTSGGYDPVHPGHLSCIRDAHYEGDECIVVVNDDDFLIRKKGRAFMSHMVRCQIMSMFDDSVCEALEIIRPDIFAKGGDRNIDNIPEKETCDKLGIKIVQGMGDNKYWSSSNFLESWGKYYSTNIREE